MLREATPPQQYAELFRRHGDVNGVVFPCGWILDQASGAIRVYYGGADACVALATAQLADLLSHLHECPVPSTQRQGVTFSA